MSAGDLRTKFTIQLLDAAPVVALVTDPKYGTMDSGKKGAQVKPLSGSAVKGRITPPRKPAKGKMSNGKNGTIT